jgi:DNA-binding Lrp family transcriptional regulator
MGSVCIKKPAIDLDAIDRRLLNDFQRNFPLSSRPYDDIATALGIDVDDVLARLDCLQKAGMISRVGAVVAPQRAGWSTLAAMAVPTDQLDDVADQVSAYPEVNHNYEREHRLNLWFVVTGPDQDAVAQVLRDIKARTGLEVFDLPMLDSYKLDLGFDLQWM